MFLKWKKEVPLFLALNSVLDWDPNKLYKTTPCPNIHLKLCSVKSDDVPGTQVEDNEVLENLFLFGLKAVIYSY